MARVVRIIEIPVLLSGARGRRDRHALKVVECAGEGGGCPYEPGIRTLWFSGHFSRRGRGPRSGRAVMLREAEAFARRAQLALEVGLDADAPVEAVGDLREERGLARGTCLRTFKGVDIFVSLPHDAAGRPAHSEGFAGGAGREEEPA
jgi:hypothetical protein